MTSERIKALREARGWTQAELARRLNITRNGVNSWEQGLSMPSPACLVDLAKLFSVSTDYLLGVERLEAVNVTGLKEEDIALLAQLADRLREPLKLRQHHNVLKCCVNTIKLGNAAGKIDIDETS